VAGGLPRHREAPVATAAAASSAGRRFSSPQRETPPPPRFRATTFPPFRWFHRRHAVTARPRGPNAHEEEGTCGTGAGKIEVEQRRPPSTPPYVMQRQPKRPFRDATAASHARLPATAIQRCPGDQHFFPRRRSPVQSGSLSSRRVKVEHRRPYGEVTAPALLLAALRPRPYQFDRQPAPRLRVCRPQIRYRRGGREGQKETPLLAARHVSTMPSECYSGAPRQPAAVVCHTAPG